MNDTNFTPEDLRLIAAALAVQKVERVAASITPLPGTGQFVAIGTPADIAKLLPVAAPTFHSTTAAEWISVDERLPDLHVTVALLDESRWMNTGSDDHSVNWHGAGYLCEFGQKYWSVFGEMRSQCLDAVTHWMSLPPAPGQQVAHVPTAAEIRAQALEEAIAVVPGGSICDPQHVADAIRALAGRQVAQGEKGGDE